MLSKGIFWLTCLAFILLPQLLSTLFTIVTSIKNRGRCGDTLLYVFVGGLLYPLALPISSIYLSASQLLTGEDEEERLTSMKGMKIFEHLGQYFLFIIL